MVLGFDTGRDGVARKLVVLVLRVEELVYDLDDENELDGREEETEALAVTAASAFPVPKKQYAITPIMIAKPIVAMISHCSAVGRLAA